MNFTEFLCDTLCISKAEIERFAATAPHRYKVYDIPKRNGAGKRTIAHPSKELKFIQRLIVGVFEKILPVHDAAMAYKKNIGIKQNASAHLNSKYLLKMDFKDFFPSIDPNLFFTALSKSGIDISESDKKLLSNLLFWKLRRNSPLRLSIGAPSSPIISNFVMFRFDAEISKICENKKVSYTRYADDITFSSNIKDVLFDYPEIVTKPLKNNTESTIRVNSDKTVFSSKAHNRHVTGITLSNDGKLSLGREKKRIISAMIHRFKLKKLSNEKILELQGFIAYARHIEPEFYKRLTLKYGHEILKELFSSN